MLNVYEHEKREIEECIYRVSRKWWGKPNSPENMNNVHREIVGRLEDLGFIATVDVTPTVEGRPIDVRIDARIDKHSFDFDKQAAEIKKGV